LQIAEAHKIDVSNLQWYAAFHNTTHHPHMHLMVYSKDPKQGYLTNKAIEDMREMFANDIFRNEMYHLFTLETQMRDEVKQEARDKLEELLQASQTDDVCSKKMYSLLNKLAAQLKNYQGKMMYGYMPKPVKETVDEIVKELAKDERIADFYAEWNKINREKLSTYFDTPKPDIPLEENKEFRSIKNAVIKATLQMTNDIELSVTKTPPVNSTVTGLVSLLGKLLSLSCQKHRSRLNNQIDRKLRSKIEKKKAAHGIRTDNSVSENNEEDRENEMHGMIL